MNTRIKTAAFVPALFALSSFGPLGQTAKAHAYAKSNQPDRVQVSQQFRAAATIGAELPAGRRRIATDHHPADQRAAGAVDARVPGV